MNEDYELLKKRFKELADKSYNGCYFTFTDFLGLMEQSAFAQMSDALRGYTWMRYGGADGSERVMIRFGNADDIGYDVPFPIVCIKIEPLAQKFADKLTHRDFLGALLNLGIERDTLGDIIIRDNVGYLFAKDDMAEFITGELSRIKRTDVKASVIDALPSGELYRTEIKRIQLSGERLDAIVAKAYSISRDDSQSLFKKRLVYVNGKLCESTSYSPRENDKISVRGYGRFVYLGYDGLSRKGKLNATVAVYI